MVTAGAVVGLPALWKMWKRSNMEEEDDGLGASLMVPGFVR